jgi:hypothetical protein
MNSPIFDAETKRRHQRARSYPNARPEQRVVWLLETMDALTSVHADMAEYDTHPMDVVPQHVVEAIEALGTAVRGMFNEDIGRLDPSTVDAEVIEYINKVGGNPDAS